MINRYTRPAMGAIWTDAARYARWLEVEILACEAMAARGVVPKKAVATIRRRARIDPERIAVLEAEVKHDIIAFVRAQLLSNAVEQPPFQRVIVEGDRGFGGAADALSLLQVSLGAIFERF